MSTDRPRVMLLGLGPTTGSALDGLSTDYEIVGLIRPGSDEVVVRARERGVPIIGDASLPALRRQVAAHEPECVVVSSYDRILPADLVETCRFVNVHYAPLPRLRGRATVNWSVINGDDRAWISIHSLVPGLDAGGILFQDSVPIGPRATVSHLYDALNELQARHLAAAVRRSLSGDPGEPQDEARATYACTRVPDDGEVEWSRDADRIDRSIRALVAPFPGAYTWLGLDRLWIDEAEPVHDGRRWEGRVPGRVITVNKSDGSVDVLAGSGTLRVRVVRMNEGDPVPAATVIRSVKSTLGLRSADLIAELRALRSGS